MKKCGSMVWVLGIVSVVFATRAQAFVEPQGGYRTFGGQGVGVGIRVLRPNLVSAKSLTGAEMKVDRKTGAARIIPVTGYTLLTGATDAQDYLEAAKQYVEANSDSLGVALDDLVWNEAATLIDADVQFISFRVQKQGTLVQDANLAFRFKFGQLIQVVNQAFAEATDGDESSLAVAQLEDAARSSLLADKAVFRGDRYRVRDAGTQYLRERVAEYDVTAADGKTFVVQVVKASGEVFEIRPNEFYLNGTAQGSVYQRYYNDSEQKAPYSNLTLTYSGGSIKTGANGEFTGAPNTSQPKLDGFIGGTIKVTTRSGTRVTRPGLPSRNGWDVVYQKGDAVNFEDKEMAQSMAFFHLNKQVDHAKRYIKAAWLDRTLTANVNLAQTCNAYWDGSTINMFSAGGGCANTALIADVLYHEWGHGLDDNTGGIDDGAYSEGFGDIISLVMTNSNILGIGFRSNNGSPVRDLTNLKVYPKDANQEVHSEGLIIGGTFWDLFNNLKGQYGAEEATNLLAKYAYKSIFTATKYTDVYEALLVIDDNNGNSRDKTPNFCHINKAFARHGLAVADSSCK